MSREDIVVIGAGPAGLAAAHELRREGLDPLVVEKGPSPATSGRRPHDHLHLNTHRTLSHQPGRRIPRRYGQFPHREDYVDYLTRYADDLRVRTDSEITRIGRLGDRWVLHTVTGAIDTGHVVVATGPDAEPRRPHWPGEETFTGDILHAAEFTRLADADNRDVLVVGPGNSGVDLLNHLVVSSARNLWLSARGGMNIIPTRLLGIPLHPIAVSGRHLPVAVQDAMLRLTQRVAFGDLTAYGYPSAQRGALSRFFEDNVAPAVDDGFVNALKGGRVTMRPPVTSFDESRVVFADGTTCQPDLVLCATGYRPALERLTGHLVTLDHLGLPPGGNGTPSGDDPGLWFFGLERGPYGNLVPLRRNAKHLAVTIARHTGRRSGRRWLPSPRRSRCPDDPRSRRRDVPIDSPDEVGRTYRGGSHAGNELRRPHPR